MWRDMCIGHVPRGSFFLQLATQWRFKLPFTREIASCNTSSLQNNPTAGHIQQLAYVYNSTGACNIFFTQTLRCKLQEKIASCDSALCDWEINVLKFNCELWLTVQICIGRQYYFQQGKLKYIIQSRNPVEIQPHSANLILYNLILFILVLVPALET